MSEYGNMWKRAGARAWVATWRYAILGIYTRILEDLAADKRISPAARSIYLASMFYQPRSIQSLADAAGMGRKAAARLCDDLQKCGWMKVTFTAGGRCAVATIPLSIESKLAGEIQAELDMAAYKGEAGSKKFLDWMIPPSVYQIDNARPAFLKNPETDRPLEYDRYAPPDGARQGVAWEYNGDQHFGPTEKYPDRKAYIELRKRDLMKVGLSRENHVNLIIITKQDLTFRGMLMRIPPEIPQRHVDPDGPFIRMLDQFGMDCAGRHDWDRS